MNRVALFQVIEPLIAPTPTEREELRKSLDKVLVEAAIALPYDQAQKLTSAHRSELEIVIRDIFVARDLVRLAAKWEPRRRLESEFKETLRVDLIDLLKGGRPPYTGTATIGLEEAQRNPDQTRVFIERSLPTAEAKKLLKAWDKRIKPMPKVRNEIVSHLLALLDGSYEQPRTRVA